MEENNQDQATEQDQEQDSNVNMDAIVEKVREEFKSELAGLNRTIGKLTKEKEETARVAEEEAKAKLTVSERLQKMEDDLIASKAEAEAERSRYKMTKTAMTELEAAGLPASVIEKLDISSEETIQRDIEFFSNMLSGYEQTAKDEVRKKHAFKPGTGEIKHSVPKSLAECKTKEEKIAYLNSKR